VAPSLEASREIAGVGEIGVAERVLESELDLGVGGRLRKHLPRGRGGGGGRWKRIGVEGGGASTFDAELFVVKEKLVGLKT